MDPGAYNRKVSIEKRNAGTLDAGRVPKKGASAYTERCKIWCNWKHVRGDEKQVGNSDRPLVDVELRTHWRSDIRRTDQVVVSRYVEGEPRVVERYDIVDLDSFPSGDGQELRILAALVKANE